MRKFTEKCLNCETPISMIASKISIKKKQYISMPKMPTVVKKNRKRNNLRNPKIIFFSKNIQHIRQD